MADETTWQTRKAPVRMFGSQSSDIHAEMGRWISQISTKLGKSTADKVLAHLGKSGAKKLSDYLNSRPRGHKIHPVIAFDLYVRAQEAGMAGSKDPVTDAGKAMKMDPETAFFVYRTVGSAMDKSLMASREWEIADALDEYRCVVKSLDPRSF